MTHYPIRQKGEKRRLEPNREGIAWLEAGLDADTEIVMSAVRGTGYWAYRATMASGWHNAKFGGNYARPMFDLISTEYGGPRAGGFPSTDPCPACLDFSRSWQCDQHPEVPWDSERKVWTRQAEPSGSVMPANLADRLLLLGDFTATFNRFSGRFWEVSGETAIEGVRSFHYELEEGSDEP